jgi:seryl-tRNA synthetase
MTTFCQAHQELTQDLKEIKKTVNKIWTRQEKREVRNGHTQKRIEEIGQKTEETDKTHEERITNLEKAVITINNTTTQNTKNINTLQKLLYTAIGLIISFFITFGYKTIILGI